MNKPTKTWQVAAHGKTFTVGLYEDPDSDQSDTLGTWTEKPENAFDRRTGELLNENGVVVFSPGSCTPRKIRSTCCYFFKPAQHVPHNPSNWDGCVEDQKVAAITQYGSLEQADYNYAYQDWQRAEALLRCDWNYVGIVVSAVVHDSFDTPHESLWGIESDSGQEYFDEVAHDLIQDWIANYGNTETDYEPAPWAQRLNGD